MKESLDGGLACVIYLGWVEIILPVPHGHQAPILAGKVSPHFQNRAPNHQGRAVEGETLW